VRPESAQHFRLPWQLGVAFLLGRRNVPQRAATGKTACPTKQKIKIAAPSVSEGKFDLPRLTAAERFSGTPDFVDYDEWFIREVEKGLAAADSGEFIDHEEIGKLINSRYPA
jgi:predicted transcriptional regulator